MDKVLDERAQPFSLALSSLRPPASLFHIHSYQPRLSAATATPRHANAQMEDLKEYKEQLAQVDEALQLDPNDAELKTLREELMHLIDLTQSLHPQPAASSSSSSSSPAPPPSIPASSSSSAMPNLKAGDDCMAKYAVSRRRRASAEISTAYTHLSCPPPPPAGRWTMVSCSRNSRQRRIKGPSLLRHLQGLQQYRDAAFPRRQGQDEAWRRRT